jgi:hypothetical protein
MNLPLVLLALQTASAGHWLPEPDIELDAGVPWAMEQPANSRRLIRLDPGSTLVEAWVDGVRVPLVNGPADTLLVPSASSGRVLSIRSDDPVTIEWWRETSQGEAAAWDRYTSALQTWAVIGGEVPEAPISIPSHRLEWAVRRAAMVELGELDTALLVQCALIEIDGLRSTTPASAATTLEEPTMLGAGQRTELDVIGPGRVTLRSRASIGAEGYRRYQLLAGVNDGPPAVHRLFATEDLEHQPGWGWPREVVVAIPPGSHRLWYELGPHRDAELLLEVVPEVARRRPSLAAARATFPTLREPGPRRATQGLLGQMEVAHLTGHGDVIALASELLGTPADDLARARLIEHQPDPTVALAIYESQPPTGVTAMALASRWIEHQDVQPAVLLEAAELLPPDPEMLAQLADGLPWGFLRPRGRVIRNLAGLEEPGVDDSRWTQLAPSRDKQRVRVPGVGGGVHRVGVEPSSFVEVVLPEPAREGRFPVLRLSADEPTTYRIDGAIRRGSGQLDEALAPGLHTVTVEQGRLFVLDAPLASGGLPYRDKAAGPLPNRWVLPDPGAPGEVEIVAWGDPGPILISADDGAIFSLEIPAEGPTAGEARASLWVGASARELIVEGSTRTRVAVALRRNNTEPEVELPSPWPDPLETLASSSQAMIVTRDAHQLADLRLRRAVSLGALGLIASSQREARAVAAMPEATPQQRAQGMAIYRSITPPVHTAEVPGPITVDAALAWMERPPVGDVSCGTLAEIADSIVPPVSWAVHHAAAECLLDQGDAVGAWMQASEAGTLGRVARLRAASSGDWQAITRMDLNGGTRRVRLVRDGPDDSDGLLAVVRELSLGAPWQPHEYSVLRDRKTAALEFDTEAPEDLVLELLCRDESFSVSPLSCESTVLVDGVPFSLDIPEATIVRRSFPLEEGSHSVEVGPLQDTGQALAVRVLVGEAPLPPRLELTAHLVGPRGAKATVAAGSLLRVRVHAGGPLRVRVGDDISTIDDVAILAVPGRGAAMVAIDGPSRSLFTLSRLDPCVVTEPEPESLPPPLDTNTTDPRALTATNRWMNEVAAVHAEVQQPVGQPGTLLAWGTAGDDATGVRDATSHYPYLGAGGGWLQRLEGTRHWFAVDASSRVGIGAQPGAHLDSSWTWAPGNELIEVDTSLGGSGGAGHARLRAMARHRFIPGPWWTIQPYAAAHIGWYSASPSATVDPLAWSAWSAQHWTGATLGSHMDWRPLSDARLRLTADMDSNADFTPDRARIELRTDAMLLPLAVLRIGPELGYRFQDTHRSQAYWRLALKTGLSYAGYSQRNARWSVSVRADWLPIESTLEGWLRFQWEWSRARGMRDHAPHVQVFSEAYDLPLGL